MPHIYSSVGYWVTSVFFKVFPQPSVRQPRSAPHFLVYDGRGGACGTFNLNNEKIDFYFVRGVLRSDVLL